MHESHKYNVVRKIRGIKIILFRDMYVSDISILQQQGNDSCKTHDGGRLSGEAEKQNWGWIPYEGTQDSGSVLILTWVW